MQKRNSYDSTLVASFVGYIVQAVVLMFGPLLFVQFQREFSLPLSQITLLVTMNFVVQLVTDAMSAIFVDRIGYRKACVLAHMCAFLGLVLLTILPSFLKGSFFSLALPMMIYSVGGGLIEVVISPLVESCPTPNKEKAMSMLHSFFCWGSAAVVLLSTLFFRVFGIENWRICALLWSIIPLVNTFAFMRVPIFTLVQDGTKRMSLTEIFKNKLFWYFVLLMLFSGASELAVSQWASTYAEKEMAIPKVVGDLLGPMLFAVLAGAARTFYGKFGDKIDLTKFMTVSAFLCIISYMLLAFSGFAFFGLLGCALCGLSSAIMWPGSYSLASASIKGGGTMMFAFLAIAGDLGGTIGPAIIGTVSSLCEDNLKSGFGVALIFPIGIFVLLVCRSVRINRNK